MISVILALVLAQLFLGLATLVQSHARVRPSVTHGAWVVSLFIFTFQHWWSLWDFRDLEWNFAQFLFSLVGPSLLFFAATLVSPREVPGDEIDLEDHFQHVRRPLMSVMVIALVFTTLDGPLFGTEASWNLLRLQQILLAAGMLGVLVPESPRVHAVWSVVFAAAATAGIFVRFLPGVIS